MVKNKETNTSEKEVKVKGKVKGKVLTGKKRKALKEFDCDERNASFMGEKWEISLNGQSFIIRFDGSKRKFPEEVTDFLNRKVKEAHDHKVKFGKASKSAEIKG